MTEPKWTPGPWTTSLTDETFVRSADNDVAVMIGDYSDDATSLIMAANANLIAAAPDLYAATDFVKFIEEKGFDEENYYVDLEDDDECICLTFKQFREIMLARRKARGE